MDSFQCKKRTAALKEKNNDLVDEIKRLQAEQEAEEKELAALEAEEVSL